MNRAWNEPFMNPTLSYFECGMPMDACHYDYASMYGASEMQQWTVVSPQQSEDSSSGKRKRKYPRKDEPGYEEHRHKNNRAVQKCRENKKHEAEESQTKIMQLMQDKSVLEQQLAMSNKHVEELTLQNSEIKRQGSDYQRKLIVYSTTDYLLEQQVTELNAKVEMLTVEKEKLDDLKRQCADYERQLQRCVEDNSKQCTRMVAFESRVHCLEEEQTHQKYLTTKLGKMLEAAAHGNWFIWTHKSGKLRVWTSTRN